MEATYYKFPFLFQFKTLQTVKSDCLSQFYWEKYQCLCFFIGKQTSEHDYHSAHCLCAQIKIGRGKGAVCPLPMYYIVKFLIICCSLLDYTTLSQWWDRIAKPVLNSQFCFFLKLGKPAVTFQSIYQELPYVLVSPREIHMAIWSSALKFLRSLYSPFKFHSVLRLFCNIFNICILSSTFLFLLSDLVAAYQN